MLSLAFLAWVTLAPLLPGNVAQQAYVKASNTAALDDFGRSVAIDGDTLIVGAPLEDSAAVGVGGDQQDDSAGGSGAVYVLVRSGPSWVQQAYLKASNTGPFDRFGAAVAIDGDTLVVGAPDEDSSATGVDGNGANDLASDSGAVYVFVRNGASWSQQAYLKASNTGPDDGFGRAVGLSGDTLVVGADGEDSAATGIDGDQASDGSAGSGAAYVFVRSGSSWSQQAYLKPSNTGFLDAFGESVAISGERIVVGAPDEDGSASGVNGDPHDDGASGAGAAYVFVRSAGTWSQEAYLKASNTDAGDGFGVAVALDGERALVGAFDEDGSATGVDGAQTNGAGNAGAAYVFVRSGSSWSQEGYLKASNTAVADKFGGAVALSGDCIAVGAFGEDSASVGIGGDQGSDGGFGSGAAYLFARAAGAWHPAAYLKASNTGSIDQFGLSLALSGTGLVVGARGEDSSATGVDGDEGNNGAADSGAAYVLDLDAASAFPSSCEGTAASCPCANAGAPANGCDNAQGTGGVQLFATGTPALDDVVLHGTGFPIAGTPGVIVMRSPGLEGAPVSFGDGSRCVASVGLVRLGATSAANAISTHPLHHGAGPGAFHYQLWYRNTPASFCTPDAFNASNGLTIVWP